MGGNKERGDQQDSDEKEGVRKNRSKSANVARGDARLALGDTLTLLGNINSCTPSILVILVPAYGLLGTPVSTYTHCINAFQST